MINVACGKDVFNEDYNQETILYLENTIDLKTEQKTKNQNIDPSKSY